jgi:hypothetical protein
VTRTSPHSVAFGAMYADGSTSGGALRCVMSILLGFPPPPRLTPPTSAGGTLLDCSARPDG